MKGKYILVFVSLIAILVAAFFFFNSQSGKLADNSDNPSKSSLSDEAWYGFELKDVKTQETFKISDFSDKPVLIESFAVWCPTCTKQQGEIKKLHSLIGYSEDKVVSISLDTDPNEDESKILEHLQRNGFDWYYAVSPPEFTQALVDSFGVEIVNAPSAPVILVCNGNAQLLKRGLKTADELKLAVDSCRG